MMRCRDAILMIVALCVVIGRTPARAEGDPGAIRWKTQSGTARPAAEPAGSAALVTTTRDRHLVVQFNKVPGRAQRAALANQGITLQRYLGNNAFFARVKGRPGSGQAALAAGLRGASAIRHEWKLHPRLLRGELPDYARIPADIAGVPGAKERKREAEQRGQVTATEEVAALYVVFHPDVDLDTAAATVVGRYGGTVRSPIRSINAAVVWLPADRVQAFAEEDEVQWVEPPLPPLDVSNDSNRYITQADIVQA
ncbi:MAG: hypothetical protein HY718_20460, partial [Planctomycetes bacterium]|nr:hypothetical protein [Planctomycetota bacterium]